MAQRKKRPYSTFDVRAVSLLIVSGVFLASLVFAPGKSGFLSAEVSFSDDARSGLSIVPASCESAPPYEHVAGECSSGPIDQCPSLPGVQTSASECAPIADACPDVNGIQTSPSQCASPMDVCPQPGIQTSLSECPTTIDYCADTPGIQSSPTQCPPFDYCPSTPGIQTSANQCQLDETPRCPIGYRLEGKQCVRIECPNGYVLSGDSCVFEGQGICARGCQGRNLVDCRGTIIQSCSYQCSAGACIGPPPPAIDIRARPSLVRKGAVSEISWTASNVKDCRVQGTNGDTWTSGGGSHTEVSRLIETQVTFTLECTTLSGALVADKAVVNVIPSWLEI